MLQKALEGPKPVEDYFVGTPAINILNHVRQGGLALYEVNKYNLSLSFKIDLYKNLCFYFFRLYFLLLALVDVFV